MNPKTKQKVCEEKIDCYLRGTVSTLLQAVTFKMVERGEEKNDIETNEPNGSFVNLVLFFTRFRQVQVVLSALSSLLLAITQNTEIYCSSGKVYKISG